MGASHRGAAIAFALKWRALRGMYARPTSGATPVRFRPGSWDATPAPNGAWDNDAFRGYADYALGAEFDAALDELRALARDRPTAIMCAEGLWWRCHRRLIADRLVVSGWTVCHIGPDGGLAEHALPPFADPQADGTVRYPPAQGSLFGS
jgi:hypothetical protein